MCSTISTPTWAPSRFGLAATSRSVAAAAWNSRSYSAGRVRQRQFGDLGRQREDHVEVLDRQQVLGLAVEPAGAGQGLALGTVAVAARVVGDALVAAVEAALDVPAQRRGAAAGQVAQRLLLRAGQMPAVSLARNAVATCCRITSATSHAGRRGAAAVMAGPPRA